MNDSDNIILLPVEEIRAFRLPRATVRVNGPAAAVFAESLQETQWWSGDPVEVSIEHGLILRNAFKVLGGLQAGVDFIPVVDIPVADLQEAEDYANHRDSGAYLWARDADQDQAAPIGEIDWRVLGAEFSGKGRYPGFG